MFKRPIHIKTVGRDRGAPVGREHTVRIKRVRQFIRKHFNHQQTYLDNSHNCNSINTILNHSIDKFTNSNSTCNRINKFNNSRDSINKNDPDLQTLTTEALDTFPLDSNEQNCITFPKRRRLSLGIGNDQFMLPEPEDDGKKSILMMNCCLLTVNHYQSMNRYLL